MSLQTATKMRKGEREGDAENARHENAGMEKAGKEKYGKPYVK